MNRIQQNLQYLIEKHGLNPTALAGATGVHQPTIHRILRGESKDPRTSNLERLAQYFQVSVEALRNEDLKGAGQSSRASSPETAAIERSFEEHLPSDLKRYFRNTDAHQGFGYRFLYCSPKVVAELKLIPFMRSGQAMPIHGLVSRVAWTLSAHRLLTRDEAPDRKYFLFLVLPSGENMGAVRADSFARAYTETRLHGIELAICSPALAAEWVASAEVGKKPDFLTEEFD